MVVAKNKKVSTKYIYGNVAYDLEPEISPVIKKKAVKKRKTNNSHKFKLMGKIVVVFVLSFLLVYRFTMVMNLTYNIRNIKTEMSQINNENENLKINIAGINNIKNIEKIAVEKDGMVVPDRSHIRYVSVKPLTLSSEKYSQSSLRMVQRLLGLIY